MANTKKKVVAVKKDWVIVRAIKEKPENGAICKFHEDHYNDQMKHFELLKRGTYKEIVNTDISQYSLQNLTAEDIEEIQNDGDTIVMDITKGK